MDGRKGTTGKLQYLQFVSACCCDDFIDVFLFESYHLNMLQTYTLLELIRKSACC